VINPLASTSGPQSQPQFNLHRESRLAVARVCAISEIDTMAVD
jgi:hypothetical protein